MSLALLPPDAPPWARILSQQISDLQQAVTRKRTADRGDFISASAVERRFGLRHGTVRTAYEAGQIKAREKPGRSYTGQVLEVTLADAQALWGVH